MKIISLFKDRSLITDILLTLIGMISLTWVLSLVFLKPLPAQEINSEEQNEIGSLTTAVNKVRRRLDGTLIWRSLYEGNPIYDNDALYVPESHMHMHVRVPRHISACARTTTAVVRDGAARLRRPEEQRERLVHRLLVRDRAELCHTQPTKAR